MAGIGERQRENAKIPADVRTQADEWVGVYEGSGDVDVFDSGEHYSEVRVCLEMRIEDRLLSVALNLEIFPPPDALVQRLPAGSSAPSGCSEGGAVVSLSTATRNVTSNTVLTLNHWPGSSPEDARGRRLRLERQGDDIVGTLTVYLGYGSGAATGSDGELASVALRVRDVDG